jgi:hypothetical protein
MRLTFTKKPAYRGEVHQRSGISAQFYETPEGKDMLKVTSSSPRQVIHVPITLVSKVLEDQWTRDSLARSARVVFGFDGEEKIDA